MNTSFKIRLLFLFSFSFLIILISIGFVFNLYSLSDQIGILLFVISLLNLAVIISLLKTSLFSKGRPEISAVKPVNSVHENEWRAVAKQIAHEIKNPLTPLKLGVQLLEKSWRDKDPNFDKKFERFTQSFIEQIESLSFIASEFSSFAKMPDADFENIHLQEIINRTIRVYETLPELSITFTDRIGTSVYIKGNKDQLLRVFNSLIKNAIEAIPDYRKGIIEIITEKSNGNVRIEVKDNGMGIPPDLHEVIFRPNFTTKSSGTGLGLAFVKQAVENMKGEINFDTEPNIGTTFYISIPIVV